MFIARDHNLSTTDQRQFDFYITTYPTDQSKFTEYSRLFQRNQRNERMLNHLLHDFIICRSALIKIAKGPRKSRIDQPQALPWAQQLAQQTLTLINPKEN